MSHRRSDDDFVEEEVDRVYGAAPAVEVPSYLEVVRLLEELLAELRANRAATNMLRMALVRR
jgi:hypothetical protein